MGYKEFQNNQYLMAEDLNAIHQQGGVTVTSLAEMNSLPTTVKKAWYNGELYKRNASGTWDKLSIEHSHPYARTDGTNATGTWPISITGSAGNADTVDGQHFAWADHGNVPTYLWGANSNGSSFLTWTGRFSGAHDHPYSGTGHTHYWQTVTGPYSVDAGQEHTFSAGKAADEEVFLTLRHSSAYLHLGLFNYYSTSYSVKIRNSTENTNHSGIYVHHLHTWRSAK